MYIWGLTVDHGYEDTQQNWYDKIELAEDHWHILYKINAEAKILRKVKNRFTRMLWVEKNKLNCSPNI